MWEYFNAKINSIFIADKPNTFVTNKISEAELDYGGIPGDLHFGLTKSAGAREPMYPRGTTIFNRRQISIVSIEECAIIAERLGVEYILPEWLGANIALESFPNLTKLTAGSRILFPSGAGLLCEGDNPPCIHPGKVIQQIYPDQPKLSSRFVKASLGIRGIVCVVERPGKIVSGETAKITVQNPPKTR
jgi:hypothetical protein